MAFEPVRLKITVDLSAITPASSQSVLNQMQVLELIFTNSYANINFDRCHMMAAPNMAFGVCSVMTSTTATDDGTQRTVIRIGELRSLTPFTTLTLFVWARINGASIT